MRTSVFIAAIGAAAVLGGVVGGATMRVAIGRDDRLAAVERLLARQAPPVTSEAAEMRWWCGAADVCYRDRAKCEDCRERRVAFCPVNGTSVEACFATLSTCQKTVAKLDTVRGCVGVE